VGANEPSGSLSRSAVRCTCYGSGAITYWGCAVNGPPSEVGTINFSLDMITLLVYLLQTPMLLLPQAPLSCTLEASLGCLGGL
jgi:hypothetical protein